MEIVAKTLEGFEQILANEIEDIGGTDIEIFTRAVAFKGDLKLLYKANYCLRTAIRVLKPIVKFEIRSQESYYKTLLTIPWDNYIDNEMTFAVNATCSSDIFTHSKYLALKTKDGIVDFFRDKTGKRPNVDVATPDIRFDILLRKSEVTISLDSSDYSLHKRNYKKNAGIAPLSEVLAAGLIIASGWDKTRDFVDPMCGSGTLAMEATMIANNIPAQFKREEFGFKYWKNYEKEIFLKVVEEENAKIIDNPVLIYASDKSQNAIQSTKSNINESAVFENIIVKKEDFFLSEGRENSHLILNPPYDERIKHDDLNAFYGQIGDTFKKKWQNCEAWIFSGNKDALKSLGLRTSKKLSFKNGPIDCKFHKYEMYAGTRKNK